MSIKFLERGVGRTFLQKRLPRNLPPALAMMAVLTLLNSGPAHAMHISEGILPVPWALFWFVLAIPFVFLGLKNLKERSLKEPHLKALVGLVGAAVFVISCMPIPVPTAGTCSHPCGTGMAAILIGPTLTVLVASVALVLQALFLAHGGLTTLGADIVSMGVAGSFAGYGVFLLFRKLGASWIVAAFAAGLISDWATYGVTSLALATALHTDGSFSTMLYSILLAFVPTQLPLGILEGFLTAGAYSFIHARRPEYLGMLVKGDAR
jgi:cobalt/nickel transport system permease protein